MQAQPPDVKAVSGVMVVVLADYLRQHQAWGWMRLAQGPSAIKDAPGLQFAKVMGSGHGGGFSLRPSASHQGLITVFDERAQAEAFLASPYVSAGRERAREWWSAVLAIDSVRGEWDGQVFASTHGSSIDTEETEPALAVLTRASIRPAKAMAFWRFAPAAQADLQSAPGCKLAMGLGEAPLVRQCTFSLWQDTPSMLSYAHGGAHQAAIEAAYRNGFFSESLFVRMRVLSQQGRWKNHTADHG